MRQCLAIFFIVIFAFQVLPVRSVSKLLGKGQTTEEVKDDGTGDDGKSAGLDNDLFALNYSSDYSPRAYRFISKLLCIIPGDEALPASYTKDILSPPPDC